MIHPLLERQLKKLGIEGDAPTPAQWAELLERVSSTYAQADQDRYMLERSLEISSAEMGTLYDELRARSEAEIEQKNEALAQSLALANAVQDAGDAGILVVGVDGRVLSLNRRFREIWGLGDREVGERMLDIVQRPLPMVKSRDFEAAVREGTLAPDIVQQSEVEFVDGRIFERYAGPVRTADGILRARVVTYRDVTEQRRLAAQRVLVAERMASVGQLVASVAHEINNPLAYVAGNVEVVLGSLVGETPPLDTAEIVEALRDSKVGVDRIRVIVSDLRTLSRIDEDTRAPVDVRSALETALQMADNQLRHRARVVRDLADVPAVLANETRLGQVFLNLLVNAAHAIPEASDRDHAVTVRTETTATGWARIIVRDTGVGIAREHVERIFDPFFTTKPFGSGTGLGLSICRGIVNKLGGTIRVESRLGAGTTFTIELPPSSEGAGKKASGDAWRGSSWPKDDAARLRVLVVDDDDGVRRWLERALVDHDVVAVASIDAATAVLSERSFDVVLCDLMMPDRTGADLYAHVERAHPALLRRIVFMSGGVFTPKLETFLDTVPNACLRKPISSAELHRTLEDVAGTKRAA